MPFTLARSIRIFAVGFAAAGATLLGVQSHATIVTPLADNWVAEFDDSLGPFVTINFVNLIGTAIHIQKSAQFTQPMNPNGTFNTIPIVFRQIGNSSVTHIVIDDEIVTNQTGSDWTDFHMDILDSGDASFNPFLTAQNSPPIGPGNPIGWAISPFTQAAFSPDNLHLDIWGGVILNGQSWFPGDGASDGELWINVNSNWNGQFGTVFTLKETPTPTPGALALLGLAALAGRSRRRA